MGLDTPPPLSLFLKDWLLRFAGERPIEKRYDGRGNLEAVNNILFQRR